MTTKLIPLGNRVIVREIPSETYRGLRTPQATDEEHTQEHEIVTLPDGGVATVPVPIDVWALVEQLGLAEVGKPPSWATDISKRQQVRAELSRTTINRSLHVGSRVYVARHKRLKITTSAGEELYVVEVDDILAIEIGAADVPIEGGAV